MWFVYILRRSDSSFYVGSTHDIQDRVTAHNDGRGAAYTLLLKRRPIHLVYSEQFDREVDAINREQQLNGGVERRKNASSPVTSSV